MDIGEPMPGITPVEAIKPEPRLLEVAKSGDLVELLGKTLGENFTQAVKKNSGERIEIPYDLALQYREAIAAEKVFQYLEGIRESRIPDAEVKAFRYQTAEGQENDVIFLAHELLTDTGERTGSTAVYLFDPQNWNGSLLVAKEILLINQNGVIEKLSEIVEGRKIEVACQKNRSLRDCHVTRETFRMGLLETEGDRAMMWHEYGHILWNTELQNEEQETHARKRIGVYNFPKMKESGVPINVSDQMTEDLSLLVSSEVDAWDKASATRSKWVNTGFNICSEQAFVKERDQALSSYQEVYQPLFEKLPDAKMFTSGQRQ